MFVVSSINDIIVKNLVIVLETQVIWGVVCLSLQLHLKTVTLSASTGSFVRSAFGCSALSSPSLPCVKAPNKMCLRNVGSSGVSKAVQSLSF